MKFFSLLVVGALTVTAAVRLPVAARPRHARTSHIRCCTTATDEDAASFITYDSLDGDFKTMVDGALSERNKVRVMEGKPRYADVPAMIQAYYEYEGQEKSMSAEACESEVNHLVMDAAYVQPI